MMTPFAKRRLLVPEVVQTSAMDCGPAALKCLLEGFGKKASYGRLREACQTDVDGTSIDTIEEAAVQLGLDAEQIMLPVDHLLLPEAKALPAMVVVRLPNGNTHFVVAWSCQAGFVQVMDPATGRRWPRARQFLDELYVHVLPVPASAWRDSVGSEEFLGALRRRMTDLNVSRSLITSMIDGCLGDPTWRSAAALHAAVQMTASIARTGGLRNARETELVLEHLFEQSRKRQPSEDQVIPREFWPVLPARATTAGEERLLLRGAVLVRVRGRRPASAASSADGMLAAEGEPSPLSPELAAALEEPPSRPARELLNFLRADGLFTPAALCAGLLIAAAGVLLQILMFRGLFDLGHDLGLADQRLVGIGALVIFVGALLLLELPIVAATLRLGRHLEVRLRVAFLEKLTRLADRYFQSRPASDMAHRSHNVHLLRLLPDLGADLVSSTFELILTTAGLAWLDPASAWLAILAATVGLCLPLVAQPALAERELRARTHAGALSIFYLDALLGLIPIRTHGAERTVRREHEHLLVRWAGARIALQRAAVGVEGVQMLAGYGLAAWLLFDHLGRLGETGSALLFVYWALSLPTLGQAVALAARQYPIHRNVTLRLLEPLGAPEETVAPDMHPDLATESAVADQAQKGVVIDFEEVGIRAAGHTILSDIVLRIEPGSQVAILGPSGAGKSSLVALLLGWHRPITGRVLIDGAPLDGPRLESLRRGTAWVDPAVQVWNRSVLDNLRYGAPYEDAVPIGRVISGAELRDLLDKLPDGLQTPLGEGGGLVSGGEGQRVRLARAMLRPGVRLVILDEPFRGLDRERRHELLARSRGLWGEATFLCITHDAGETVEFDKVVIMEGGRIVESGVPCELARRPGSRYRALLEAEDAVRTGLWSNADWRRLRVDGGRLLDSQGDLKA